MFPLHGRSCENLPYRRVKGVGSFSREWRHVARRTLYTLEVRYTNTPQPCCGAKFEPNILTSTPAVRRGTRDKAVWAEDGKGQEIIIDVALILNVLEFLQPRLYLLPGLSTSDSAPSTMRPLLSQTDDRLSSNAGTSHHSMSTISNGTAYFRPASLPDRDSSLPLRLLSIGMQIPHGCRKKSR